MDERQDILFLDSVDEGTKSWVMVDCGGPVLMGWHRCKSDGGRVMDDGKVRG